MLDRYKPFYVSPPQIKPISVTQLSTDTPLLIYRTTDNNSISTLVVIKHT